MLLPMRAITTSAAIFVAFFSVRMGIGHAAAASPATASPAATPGVSVTRPLVLVVSVDGLGARLLSSLPPSELPTLTRLARDGDQAIRAETVLKAQTVPAHVSMLTGVDTAKHLRTHNELGRLLKPVDVPTIFDLAKMNGLKSVAVFGKEKLRWIFDTASLAKNVSPTFWPFGDLYGRLPSVVASTAIDLLTTEKPDLLFVHYAIVDTIGHALQWESFAQRLALRRVDSSLGVLLDFLDHGRWNFGHGAERDADAHAGYVLILTGDHGGHGGSHGHTTPAGQLENIESDLVIPWIVYSRPGTAHPHPAPPAGAPAGVAAPAEVSAPAGVSVTGRPAARLIDPSATIKIYDTAATAAALLGLTVPAAWNWDGINRLAEVPLLTPTSPPASAPPPPPASAPWSVPVTKPTSKR